jgi:hypothetical protein
MTGYGKRCNHLDIGLLVVTDQESGNQPHPLAKYKAGDATLVLVTQSSSNLHRQLDVGFYSLEAQIGINSLCSMCSAYSLVTFKFLALDSTPLNN